jgi:hypothetical protein
MSANKKEAGGGVNPSPPPVTPLVTLEQMQDMIMFFKQVFEDSSLGWWIKAAGLGGIAVLVASVLEVIHLGWQAVRYIWRF